MMLKATFDRFKGPAVVGLGGAALLAVLGLEIAAIAISYRMERDLDGMKGDINGISATLTRMGETIGTITDGYEGTAAKLDSVLATLDGIDGDLDRISIMQSRIIDKLNERSPGPAP